MHLPPSISAVLHPYPPLSDGLIVMPDAPKVLTKEPVPSEIYVKLANLSSEPFVIDDGQAIA